MIITKHFAENWAERVGGTPTVKQIQDIIDNAVRVQRGRYFQLSNGKLDNRLTIYWHPGLDLVIFYDFRKRTLVSVLSKANWNKPESAKKVRKPKIAPGYVPMSMHF